MDPISGKNSGLDQHGEIRIIEIVKNDYPAKKRARGGSTYEVRDGKKEVA